MSVRGGREFLAVPGPTTIPDEVLQAMQRPAVEIYSKPLIALTDSLLRDLGRLFATEGRCYIYIANGHGGFHERLGFERVAHFREVGHKFGRWLDLVFMQRFLDAPGSSR